LIGVDPVLSRHSRDRCSRYKRRLNDAALLLRCTLNPFPRAAAGNLNRIAHKVIVGLITPSVYTARSERLPRGNSQGFSKNAEVAVSRGRVTQITAQR